MISTVMPFQSRCLRLIATLIVNMLPCLINLDKHWNMDFTPSHKPQHDSDIIESHSWCHDKSPICRDIVCLLYMNALWTFVCSNIWKNTNNKSDVRWLPGHQKNTPFSLAPYIPTYQSYQLQNCMKSSWFSLCAIVYLLSLWTPCTLRVEWNFVWFSGSSAHFLRDSRLCVTPVHYRYFVQKKWKRWLAAIRFLTWETWRNSQLTR